MFFDEDGDLAHEFYEEVCEGCKYVMRRSWANLTPQVIQSCWEKTMILIISKYGILYSWIYTSRKGTFFN